MNRNWFYDVDEFGETPLSRISRSGRMDLANVLFLQQIDDALKEIVQAPEIHRAAYWGYEDVLEDLIKNGEDVDAVDRHGERPLHKAARFGHYEAARVLVDNGADINAPNALGLTPLHWATLRGAIDIAELLLDNGANMYIREWVAGGMTARDFARLMRFQKLLDVFDRHNSLL